MAVKTAPHTRSPWSAGWVLTSAVCCMVTQATCAAVSPRAGSSAGGPPLPVSPRGSSVKASETAVLTTKPAAKSQPYESFAWRDHWYPVAWAEDCERDRPFKTTLFDEDYAVVLPSGSRQPYALRDRCPHRLAALSEGRVTEQGWLQCSYHGFAFDHTGELKAVPQQQESAKDRSSCAQAVACKIVDGLVWLNPSAASADGARYPIPRVPEMADPAFSTAKIVRDMPVDYSIVCENIMDPDHGVFAHAMAGLDYYSASRDFPQSVDVTTLQEDGKVFPGVPVITSRVQAGPKVLAGVAPPPPGLAARVRAFMAAPSAVITNALVRRRAKTKSGPTTDTPPPPPLTAEITFSPPTRIIECRRDQQGVSNLLSTFWIVPVGVGRCRFLSAYVSRAPPPKRWLLQLFTMRFTDQDTHLLATQQAEVLPAELDAHERSDEARGRSLRRRLFKYRMPSEGFLVEVGKFMDATLPEQPNRYLRPELFRQFVPPREVTLDRWAQHATICPASRRVHDIAVTVSRCAVGALAALAFAHAYYRLPLRLTSVAVAILLAETARRSRALASQFKFVKTRESAKGDLQAITTLFPDERLAAGG
eukprot:CAMPEP_0185156176 /NCGR_PEP_ID=MMETSP1139-20130426/924_1 /TAXON_ID=298111 /ORGANISM="Pavlova sp., Strain CCMP459" /LENGTH=590 /DNA_ID=CAMNT_0027721137 /DNA_START=17 /DNA_END=1789 /DNA_ORIENTATION=-